MARGRPVKVRFNAAEKRKKLKPIRTITARERYVAKYDATYDAMLRVLTNRQRGIAREINQAGLSGGQRKSLANRYKEAQKQIRLLNQKYNRRKRQLEAQGKPLKRHKRFKCYLTDAYFSERVAFDGKKHAQSSLAYVDLDYLHGINTLVKHKGGNVVLQALGDALNEVLGRKGGFAGKHGGEEILVWAPVAKGEMASLLQKVAALLREKVIRGMESGNIQPLTEKEIVQKVRTGGIPLDEGSRLVEMLRTYPDIGRFSAGVMEMDRRALIKDFGSEYAKAVDAADSLHYQAKHKGRNRIAFRVGKRVYYNKSLK